MTIDAPDFIDVCVAISRDRFSVLIQREEKLKAIYLSDLEIIHKNQNLSQSEKTNRTVQAQSFYLEETEKIEKEKRLFGNPDVLNEKLIECYKKLIVNPDLKEVIRSGLEKTGHDYAEQDINQEMAAWLKVLAQELTYGYAQHISERNWSENDSAKAISLEQALSPLIERLGTMAPDNPEGKPVNFYLWSSHGNKVAESKAQEVQQQGEIGVVFQKTIPGIVINHIMDALVNEQLLSWTAENTKFIYQAASLNLAKLITDKDNLLICMPTVNASSIFFDVELKQLRHMGFPEDKILYYSLNDDMAKKYMGCLKEGNREQAVSICRDPQSWHLTQAPSFTANHYSTTRVKHDTLLRFRRGLSVDTPPPPRPLLTRFNSQDRTPTTSSQTPDTTPKAEQSTVTPTTRKPPAQ